MLDLPPTAPSPSTSLPTWLNDALAHARQSSEQQWQLVANHRDAPEDRHLLHYPSIGPSCEVLLADRVFHQLSQEERDSLLQFVHEEQHSDGTWRDTDGTPDLSLTVFGWWAQIVHGAASDRPDLQRAQEAILSLGGAQRGSFLVRLWLALAGTIAWNWLPAVPSELWMLPASSPLSITRLSSWARGVLIPFHVLASTPARIFLADPSPLLLRHHQGELVLPRLTRPGLAGDLLQAFDRTIKLSRKLPRQLVRRKSLKIAAAWLDGNQQAHGGWFGTTPTILSLLAQRASGTLSDDPSILAGLSYLRAGRGLVRNRHGNTVLAQGGMLAPCAETWRLAAAAQCLEARLFRGQALRAPGPWQQHADAPVGGWPLESGADLYLDVHTTATAIELLCRPEHQALFEELSSELRSAAEVILAMQELDGSFARFERGEHNPWLSRLPWTDANELVVQPEGDETRLRTASLALRALTKFGYHPQDDRIVRGLKWIQARSGEQLYQLSVLTLAELLRTASVLVEPSDPWYLGLLSRLRGRQQEDGSFGNIMVTASALFALTGDDAPHWQGGANKAPCVQAVRAAKSLATQIHQLSEQSGAKDPIAGLGLEHHVGDITCNAREASLALTAFARRLSQSSTCAPHSS